MTPPNPTKGGDKPAAEEPATVDVDALEKTIGELTAKVQELEAQAAHNVEVFVSSTDLDKKLEEIGAGFTAALEAEVAKYLGTDGALTKELGTRLEELDVLLQAKTETLGEEASTELEKAVQWAHAKISALHNGVQRAIGVTIPLPDSPTHEVTSDVEVTGTEKADHLVH